MKKTFMGIQLLGRITVWEILVIAAIIGVLSIMLRDDIAASPIHERAKKMAANGQAILKGTVSGGARWLPKVDSMDYGHTSTEYFSWRLATGSLAGFDTTFFAGGGVPPCVDDVLLPTNNAWKIVAGLNWSEPDSFPFLFTRNVGITTEDIRNWPGGTEPIPLAGGGRPFSQAIAIVITKGGEAKIFRPNALTWDAVYKGHGTNSYDYLEVWDVE